MKNGYQFLAYCFLISALFTRPAQAQTNFRPGYVLPLAGDTLRGEVDLRDSRANSQRCRFRASPDAAVTTYSPAELRGYGLPAAAKRYRTLSVAASRAAQPYFLEVLVDGPASLYFLRDAQQHEFYYVASPKLPLTLLEHSFVQVVRDGHVYNEERSPFRNTLAIALAGCAPAQATLPRLLFQETSLRKVVQQYNACQGYQAHQEQPTDAGGKAVFGVMAGGGSYTLSYSGFPYRDATVTDHSTGVVVGPTLRFSSGRLSQKLALVMALLYGAEKYEIDAPSQFTGAPSGSRTRSRFDLAYLRLPVMFRYTYPRGKVAPVAELGFTLAYALKTTNTVEQTNAYYANGVYSPPETFFDGPNFRSIQLGAGVGLGLSTRTAAGHAVALLFRAEQSNGFSGRNGIGTSVLRFYGLLHYDLTK